MKRFLECTKGNFAVAFSIAVLPVLGAAGVAVDYSRALNVQSFMQAQADAAALAAIRVGHGGKDTAHLEYVKAAVAQRFGGDWVGSLTVEAEWPTVSDYRVVVRGAMPVTLLSAVPGLSDAVPLSVTATARIGEPRYVYEAPEMAELDNEAGDYNRIYVYCFDPVKGASDREAARSKMTAIADNAGTKYKFEMPRCDAGQTLSFKLLNVRLVRGEPAKWEDSKSQRFEYYTDTVIQGGVDKHDLGGWSVLETVLCNSLKECEKKSKGGIVPEGANRTPVQAKASCSPGKYMYYGWEDRPPGMAGPSKDWTDVAWTDRDYDDIRIVIKCPKLETLQERMVLLVD